MPIRVPQMNYFRAIKDNTTPSTVGEVVGKQMLRYIGAYTIVNNFKYIITSIHIYTFKIEI